MNRLLDYLSRTNQFVWYRIYDSTHVDIESIVVVRIFTGLLLFLFGYVDFSWLNDFPDIFFSPPFLSVAFLFDKFPSQVLLSSISIVIPFCLICLIVGIRAKFFGLLYVILNLVGNSFLFSFGKIDHGFNLVLILIGVMSFGNWGTKLALIPDKPSDFDYKKCVAFMAVIVSVAFFSAGLPKFLAWINLEKSNRRLKDLLLVLKKPY